MPYLPVGAIEVKRGVMCGSSDSIDIVVRGKGGHGAYPESSVDAILIAANVTVSLHTLVSRYVSPLHQAVLTIGTISGGTRPNIIADEVAMNATLRTTDEGVRQTLIARIRAVVEGIAASFGGSGFIDVQSDCAALVNDDEVSDMIAETGKYFLGADKVFWKEKPSMGVEDFSVYTNAIRGAFWHLGCGNALKAINAPLHSPSFDIDEDCLPIGTAMQAAIALELLERLRE
jgi:amidohydrolase